MARPKVMVAVRDAASVESLMMLACQLAQGMDANLFALHVVAVPMLTPLGAEDETIDHNGKELLSQAKMIADKFSRPLETQLLRAREVGEAVVGVAKEQRVELLVMGHYKPHPRSLGESLLGRAGRYIAHHAPCRVIVQIPAPESA